VHRGQVVVGELGRLGDLSPLDEGVQRVDVGQQLGAA